MKDILMTQFLKNLAISVATFVFVFGTLQAASGQGQVAVDLSDEGELTIVGDDDSNSVFIHVDDQITISTAGGPYSFDVLGITKIDIRMGRSIDGVHIYMYRPLLADISIDTGHAFDLVVLEDRMAYTSSSAIIGNVTINTGHGDDAIRISGIAVWGDVDISTGNGQDVIQFNSQSDDDIDQGPNNFLGNLSINTGVDNDYVIFQRFETNVGQDLLMELGQGDDFIWGGIGFAKLGSGSAFLSGGQGTDTCPADLVDAAEVIKIGFEN